MMTIVTKYIITPCLQLGQRQYTHLDAVLVVFSFSWMNAAISSCHDFQLLFREPREFYVHLL